MTHPLPCPHPLRPVRAKVKANRSPILLPLQGVGVYTLIPRALPWALNWLPFQGARGEVAGIAPERGSYSRIGACPYLSPQLINSRCCPCKGRISWAGLAPQQDSRYEPLTGARFINRPQKVGASPYPKYEPLTGAVLSPQPSRPSLCEQSELQCYRPNLRPPHFASKVSYNAAPQSALQCCAPKRQPPHLPHIFPHLL